MLPHIHILIGLIVKNSLQLEGFLSLLVILGSIFPDVDILFGLYLKKNHRLFFTHYPSFWILTSFLSVIFDSQIYWFCLAGLLHTLVDVIDWDIYLFQPISNRKFSILSLNPTEVLHTSSLIEFITNYYRHHQIVFVEVVLAILCLFSFFLY
jgi:hypothetical protein